MDRKEKQVIAESISSLKGRVNTGELVSRTGLPVLTVSRCLNQMAYECQAHLEVNSDGSLSYIFPENFAWTYRSGAMQKSLQALFYFARKIFFLLLKFLVSAILVLSLAIIYFIAFCFLEIMAVLTRMESAAAEMKRDFFSLLLFYIKTPFDRKKKSKLKMPSFLEHCFEFLFGAADPNSEVDGLCKQNLARIIRQKNGIVIPEELRVWSAKSDYDRFELEVLMRLDGMPQVTDSGVILFCFPSLAGRQVEEKSVSQGITYLIEEPWQFSGASKKQLLPVLTLSLVNLIGCNLAYFFVHSIPTLSNQPLLYWGITGLWIYGNAFLIFPLFRYLICKQRNRGIELRNSQRRQMAESLANPQDELQEKLAESAKAREVLLAEAGNSKVIFSTEKDALEQFILEPALRTEPD